MKVILTDDSQLILDRLNDMLSDIKGVEVIGSYKNGKDSLNAINTLNPKLVIIDISMPGLTGLQVIDAAKKENHNTKFIVLTFYASNYYRGEALKLGADYFLSKVDDFEKVADVVSDMIAQDNNYSMNAIS